MAYASEAKSSSTSLSVLFVCLGNICRSPSAHGVFSDKASQHGFDVRIDSAGTHAHNNVRPDKRAQQTAMLRGYDLSSLKSRRVVDSDFDGFDYIIAMDKENVSNLKRKCPEQLHHKISLFMSYCESEFDEIPDPYYGGGKGFELVLDLIEKAADGLLLKLTQDLKEV